MENTFIRKDGFCRAPRVELIENTGGFENMSFDELMNKVSIGMSNSSNLSIVRNLAELQE